MENIEVLEQLPGGQQYNLLMEYLREHARQSQKNNELLKEVDKYKSTVRKLSIYQSTLSSSMWVKLISGFSRLSSLSLSHCHIIKVSSATLNLPNLLHLSVVDSDWSVFKFLSPCTKLKSLKVDSTRRSSSSANFISFLTTCTDLISLTLSYSSKVLFAEVRNYPFKLKHLCVDNLFDPKLSAEAVIDFLRQQKETLKNLVVKNSPREMVLRYFLADMKLEKLEIGVHGLPTLVNYFHIISKNLHLRTLILRGDFSNSIGVMKRIIAQFPNIETLQFHDWELDDVTDILIQISVSLRNLRELCLPTLVCGFISPIINLENLKTLHISKVCSISEARNWKFLCIYCPHIEKLTIGEVNNLHLSNAEIEIVTLKLKNLKELCLGSNFEFDEQLYNIIKSSAKNLKKLTLCTKNIERARTSVSRIHSSGLNCHIFKFKEESQIVFESTKKSGIGGFNTIDDVEAFLRPQPSPQLDNNARQARRRRMFEDPERFFDQIRRIDFNELYPPQDD